MKLKTEMTRFAPRDGYIIDIKKQQKAIEEEYDLFFISPGYYLCVNGKKAYTISEYMKKLSCACEDMTLRCKGSEICKHLVFFMSMKNPQDLPEIEEDMAQLLIASGWSGTPLTPPDRPENRRHRPRLPNIRDPERKPAPQAAKREASKKSYEGKTAEEIVRGMDDEELERNKRKGGLLAIKEMRRREAERAVSE